MKRRRPDRTPASRWLDNLDAVRLIGRLSRSERRAVRRASWGRQRLDDPRLAALAAQCARLNRRGLVLPALGGLLGLARLMTARTGITWFDIAAGVAAVVVLVVGVAAIVGSRAALARDHTRGLSMLHAQVAGRQGDTPAPRPVRELAEDTAEGP